VVRKSSFTPSRASRLATIRDIDGCDTPSFARDAGEAAGLAGADEGGQFPEGVNHAPGV